MTTPTPRVIRECTLPWIKYDSALARNGNVSVTAKALYAAIASFVDKDDRGSDERIDGFDVPTRAVLAACIGKSVKTVDRATVELEEIGLLEVERRSDPDNPSLNLPSVYRLLDTYRWDEMAAKRHEKRKEALRSRRKDVRNGPENGSDTGVPTPEESEGGWGHGCPQGGDTGVPRGGDMGVAHSFGQKKDQRNNQKKHSPYPPEGEAADAAVSASDVRPSVEEMTGAGAVVAWEDRKQPELVTEDVGHADADLDPDIAEICAGPRDYDTLLPYGQSEADIRAERPDEMYQLWCDAIYSGRLSTSVPPPKARRRRR